DRQLAKDLLDALLEDWHPTTVPTVADISTAVVEESELERRFKVALADWARVGADLDPTGPEVTFKRVAGSGKHAAHDLTSSQNGDVTRWRIDEQHPLDTTPATVPDFLITR